MRTFRTITIFILPFIFLLFYTCVKPIATTFNLLPNYWKICKTKWSSVFFNKRPHIDSSERQFTIFNAKFLLWKVERLLYKILIFVLHFIFKILIYLKD